MMKRFDYTPGLMALGTDGGTRRDGSPATGRGSRRGGRRAPEEWCASHCLNLRRGDEGGLVAVRGGLTVTPTGAEAVMADRRDDENSFFTLDADLGLRLAAVERDDGSVERREELLARLPARADQYAVCGEFMVMRLADGRLYYLLWHADERRYSALGTLPEFGGISVERSGEIGITAPVAPSKFSGVVADPRQGDPQTYAASAVPAVEEALRKAMASAREAGYWTQPVAVRLAYRLWDGTLLHLSEPVVAGGSEAQAGGRVDLSLTANDKGYTGTAQGTLTIPAYRLAVGLPQALPAGWDDVVGSVEIWVSEEPDPLDGGASVGFSQSGTAMTIGVRLGRKSAAAVASDLGKALMERTETLSSAVGGTVLDLVRHEAHGARLDPAEEPVRVPSSATAVEGHGDHLHVASDGKVATTRRGNPFVVAGESLSPGGRVAAMAAQPTGGGAYTRQYVYLFTDRGVMGLTHDMEGRHRNIRQLSPVAVRSRSGVAQAPGGVYALGARGELLLLRDSKATTLVRGLGGYTGAACDRRHNELWLFAPGRKRWLAVSLDGDAPAGSMRDTEWEKVPVDCGGRLYVLGSRSVSRLEDDDGEELPVEWESFPEEWPLEGAATVGVGLCGDAVKASVAVWSHGSAQPPSLSGAACLGRWEVRGGVNGLTRCGVMLPPSWTGPRLSLAVGGRASRLTLLRLKGR